MTRLLHIRYFIAVLATFSLIIGIVGCSSNADPTPTVAAETPAAVTATTVPATPQPTPTATASPPENRRTGGIARIAIKQAPPHQDVHQSASSSLSAWGAGISYSRLFRHQRGSNVPLPSRIPECDLCTSWVQTGPLEFEFVIRDDAFWPDISPLNGRRVTASDIEFSLDRQMTIDWPNADLFNNLDEVIAVEDNLLRIRLKTLDAELFEKLADGRSVIVAPEVVAISGNLLNGPTLGSGPWILEELSPDGTTFEANRDYYGDGPYLDGMSVQYIAADSTRAAGVRADILDFAATTPAEVVSALDRFPELGSMSVQEPGTGVEIAFNGSAGPLADNDLRRAILLSWDIEEAVSHGWTGNHQPSVGLTLPEPSWSADFRTQYLPMFNSPEEAQRRLAEMANTSIGPLTITVGQFGEHAEDDPYVALANSLATAMTGIGIEVSVEPITTREYADNAWLNGEYEILIGAPPPVASLSGRLFGIYHSAGPWNTTGFDNPALDDLIERQASELDRASRGSVMLEIQDLIMSEAQRFYPVTGAEHWLWQPRVQGFIPDTTGSSGDFLANIWLDDR